MCSDQACLNGLQGTPLPRPVQPQQQQQAFNAGNLPTGNALLALLQGQAMRGMDPKLQLPQRPRSVEPTFANPHPAAAAQQQHQNLLNGLYPNKQQVHQFSLCFPEELSFTSCPADQDYTASCLLF